MLDTDTKRRIDTARDILVGKVPGPNTFTPRVFKAVPKKYRTLVPEYIKDYVSLNQFAA